MGHFQPQAQPVGVLGEEALHLGLGQAQGRVDGHLARFGNAQRQGAAGGTALQAIDRVEAGQGKGKDFLAAGQQAPNPEQFHHRPCRTMLRRR